MTTFVISRHAAAVDFLAQRGFAGAEVVAHADDDFWSGLTPGDRVVGTLPMNLAARACAATGNPFGFLAVETPPEARGKELSLEDMLAFKASIDWYMVEAANPPKSE